MIDNLKMAIFFVEKKCGKKELKREDFIRILSFESRWLEPSMVDKFLELCTRIHLLEKNNDVYVSQFSTKGMEIPIDFFLSPEDILNFQETKETKDIFLNVVEYLQEKTGKGKNEIVSEINKIKARMKYITIETAALIYANDLDVDVSQFIKEIENSIISKK